ncbi:MAG: hypothetical protein RMI04_09290 [Thermofilaceae archaeon]|nr:hypothetical protein [Thermofilaceae archaeon]
MMAKLLVVEPLEPLSLSRTQIPGPKYLEAGMRVFAAPQPTTVLGALGRALGVTVGGNLKVEALEDIRAVSSAISEKLRCSEPLLRGPVIVLEDFSKLYVPVAPDLYVSTENLPEVLKLEDYSINVEPCLSKTGVCIEARGLPNIIGVALERRADSGGRAVGEKTVRLGYMYRYSVTAYRDASTGEPTRTRFAYVLNCERGLEPLLLRVGGEGRVARLYTKDLERAVDSRLANPLAGLERGKYVSVSYVPLIPKGPDVLSLEPEKLYGIEFLSDSRDVIGLPGATPKVRVERVGLGYSESQRRRRPQVPALPPGTLFEVKNDVPRDVIEGRTIEPVRVLWNVGYSTLYRVR